MQRLSSRGHEVVEAIGNHEEFKTSGALRAERGFYGSFGRLNDAERRLLDDVSKVDGIDYVVYSYETPIAWVSSQGQGRVVEQKFSVTTSKHQGKLWKFNSLTSEEWQPEIDVIRAELYGEEEN